MGIAHSTRSTIQVGNQGTLRALPQQPDTMTPLVWSLHMGVIRNDSAAVTECIKQGVDVDASWVSGSFKNGCTPLIQELGRSRFQIQAISLNHVAVVKQLIDAGVNVHKPDATGMTALQKASYHGRAQIARMLVDAGADLELVDKEGNNALQLCLRHGNAHSNWSCVAALIESGASLTHKNNSGMTAIHSATCGGTTPMVACVMAAGADREQMDAHCCTPLWHCVKHIIQQERLSPKALLRTALWHRASMLRLLLVSAQVDSLGMATWLRRLTTEDLLLQMQLYDFVDSQQPESLKHLARLKIQVSQACLQFTPIRHLYCIRKLKHLDLPEQLVQYLARRVMPD